MIFRLTRWLAGPEYGNSPATPGARLAGCLLGLLLGGVPLLVGAQDKALTLSSQVVMDQRAVVLEPQDWNWLRDKRELLLGVAAAGMPPLEWVHPNGVYEGITADVAALVGQQLGVRIRLRQYPDRQALLDALQAGGVDLSIGVGDEGAQLPLAHSRPLVNGSLALFHRYDDADSYTDDLAGVRVAVPPALAPRLAERFPKAREVPVASLEEALSRVAFGQADLMLGDILPTYYHLNGAYYGLVKFQRRLAATDTHASFLVRREDGSLLRGLDAALDAAGQTRMDAIIRRWVGSPLLPLGSPLPLSPGEARWVSRNPVVRLVISEDMAPEAFFDKQGQFRGAAADLLEMVSMRTGLRFVALRRPGAPRQIRALEQGEADLAILTPNTERERTLRFSHFGMTMPLVLVGRAGEHGISAPPDAGEGMRLAATRGHAMGEAVRAVYPRARLVEASSTLDALNNVLDGDADYALASISQVRYYNDRLFDDRLAISALALTGPMTSHFAGRRADAELLSILDKAVASLPPGAFNDLANRWRGLPGMSPQSWRDYNALILRILAGAGLAVSLVLVWALHLRREIRRRKLAERQLGDELRFIETLTDSMPPPLYVRDTEGRLLSGNRSYQASLGLPLDSMLGRTAPELPDGLFEAAPEFHRLYLQAMAEGRMIQGVHSIRLGDRECWIDHWVQPFEDSIGTVKGVICGWLDITEHRRLVQELEEAKNLADAASRAKTTFLATMSHEIRTPMNAVIGILELALKRAGDAPVDRASIEVAYGSARSLLVLIGDILDIARIESGRLSLAPHRANLRELVESVARVFDGLARQKRLRLVLDIDSSIQGDVLVDAMRFKQILSNLVSNAIKFTREGSVRLQIHGEEGEPGQLRVCLSVEDTGIGISAEDQDRLFRPFAQVERGFQQTEGAGLGLVISRSLCEMMGGRLTLVSSPGQGTRVDVELRLHRLDPVEEPLVAAPDQLRERRRLRVLVVDDHPVNRQILAQQLSYLGHEVVETENGVDALAAWRAQPFDVVATDCHMPGMSGADLARAIREEERGAGASPTLILGLTADAQQEELERGRQAGMDDCLVKPVGLDLLEARLWAASADASRDEPNATDQPAAGNAPGVFDLAALTPLTGGDPGLIRNLVSELLETNRRDLQPLAALAATGDAAGLAELAHRLKGAARVVRAEPLIAACASLEQACRAPVGDRAVLEASAEDLRRAMLELEQGLLAWLARDPQ